MMINEKRWYAVYTRARWEKKVAELLVRKNVECYCPLNSVVSQWADRKKIVHQPLFSSYVFVHAADAEQITIRQTDGILNFVYWLGKPAVIRNEEIDAIRHFLHQHENIRLEKISVNLADVVRVIDGPMIDREGSVVEVKNQSVKVCLPSLGYAMIAEIRKTNIEVIRPHNNLQTKIA